MFNIANLVLPSIPFKPAAVEHFITKSPATFSSVPTNQFLLSVPLNAVFNAIPAPLLAPPLAIN